MARLYNFDYTTPFYYLVTLNARKGIEPFSVLTSDTKSGIRETSLTRRFISVITWLNRKAYFRRMEIRNYIIMPNHLHLIIKIHNSATRVSLLEVVNKLLSTLSNAYCDSLKLPRNTPIFEPEWHDWIVSGKDELEVFSDYVMNNPKRALFRQHNPNACYPRVYHNKSITWTCIGTLSPKETPIRAPVICSRSIRPDSPLWQVWKRFAQRLGPGTLAVGTFMSPCEKMVREEVLKAGGGILHLIPRGIASKGHASAEDEPLLAAGRLTFMTPFPYEQRTLTAKELHDRCHATLHPIALSLQRGIRDLPASR